MADDLAAFCGATRMTQPQQDPEPIIDQLDTGEARIENLAPPIVEALSARFGLSAVEIQELFDDRIARERRAPQIGQTAPDFSLELIDAEGQRTGKNQRLSDCRGQPVALIFGSYT